MKNIEKYLSLLGQEVDGLLLTSRYSRFYGAEFDIAEGIAIVIQLGGKITIFLMGLPIIQALVNTIAQLL